MSDYKIYELNNGTYVVYKRLSYRERVRLSNAGGCREFEDLSGARQCVDYHRGREIKREVGDE